MNVVTEVALKRKQTSGGEKTLSQYDDFSFFFLNTTSG